MNRLYQFNTPIVFAHRGASAYAPENTLAAFEKALELGVLAVELDVQLSADKEVFVIHDHTVDRTTNGTGRVSQLHSEELRDLEAGSFFSESFKNEKLPFLSEVFENFGKKLYLNIELKPRATPFESLPLKVIDLVQEYGLMDWVMFSSFSPTFLIRAKKKCPDIPVGLLTIPGAEGNIARSFIRKWISPAAVHPHKKDVTKEFVEHQHLIGRKVNAWTINEISEMKRMAECDVDGIITDKPDVAQEVIRTHSLSINT